MSNADSRALVSPSEPVNPVQIENTIRTVSNEIARGVKVVSSRLAAFRKAQRDFDLAYALAVSKADGAVATRRYQADIETFDLRVARDDAEIVYKHAERAMSALEKELSAWQTINKTVSQMFSSAGHHGQGS